MTTAQALRRTLTVGLVAAGLALTAVGAAAAGTSGIPRDAVIVSSTDLTGAFTMTASNVGDDTLSLELPAPGIASNVTVDQGNYEETWSLDSLEPGQTATMTGTLEN